MPPRSYQFTPPTNPILQVLYFILGGIFLIGAVIIGGFLLALALAMAIILGLVIFVRVWWLKRKYRNTTAGSASPGQSSSDSSVIEVEYTVVDERDEGDDRSGRQ